MPQPHVSIITPMHNDAQYLPTCIESVLAQTYQNWHYTIVDNGSTDNSLEIARRYAVRDPRIRVIPNALFLPAIANHNLALRQISPSSKYCKMVFSDDWIFPECLERMVAIAEHYPTVGIVGAYCLWGTEAQNEVGWTGLPYPSNVVSGQDICRRRFLHGLSIFGSPTSVLYRAELVRTKDPFFNVENVHADQEICLDLLRTCDFGFVHQILTFSRVHPESISVRLSDFNTCLAGDLHELLTYGPHYLTSDECRACLKQHIAKYYRFLGRSFLAGRHPSFWTYHKCQLSKAGISWHWARVVSAALRELTDAALEPKETIAKLANRITRDQAISKGVAIDETMPLSPK